MPALRGGHMPLNRRVVQMLNVIEQLTPLCTATKENSGTTNHRIFTNDISWKYATCKYMHFYDFTVFEVETNRSEDEPHDVAFADGFILGFLQVQWDHYSGKPAPFEEVYETLGKQMTQQRALQLLEQPSRNLDDFVYTQSSTCEVEDKEVYLGLVVQFPKGRTRVTFLMGSQDYGKEMSKFMTAQFKRTLN